MKRVSYIIMSVGIVLAVCTGSLLAYRDVHSGSVNGIKKAGLSHEELLTELKRVKPTYISYKNEDIDISNLFACEVPEFDMDSREDITVSVTKTIDKVALKDTLDKLKLGEYEYIEYDTLSSSINEGGTYNLELYINMEYLQSSIDKYNKYMDWSVQYTKEIKMPDLSKYVKLGNKVSVDWSFLDKIIRQVQSKYNTFGDPVKFKTHRGKKLTIDSPHSMWGNLVSVEEEKSFLKEAFKSGKVIKEREPIFEQKTGRLGNSYIEVSLSEQKVWYIKNGKVKMSSSCVSGTKGVHDTPRGVYYILERKPEGKWLTGDDYRTWVNKWLRITWTGIGLHDATWRGQFGGNIYTYSGSHGCINLPSDFATKLCRAVPCGYPVVVY